MTSFDASTLGFHHRLVKGKQHARHGHQALDRLRIARVVSRLDIQNCIAAAIVSSDL